MDPKDALAALPYLLLVGLTMGMLIVDLFGKCTRLVWLVMALLTTWCVSWPQLYFSETALQNTVYIDGFTLVFYTIILGGALAAVLLNHRYLALERASSGVDVDVLLMLAVSGAMVMVSAAHLIVVFIGFELLSVSVYALTGIARKERASAEGALKYFILGAFSSAFLLYGMVLVYGATGTMHIAEIASHVRSDNVLLLVGIGLIIFGFGFKVSLVPFHVWTPDVYQGAPTSITTFMAVVVKTAAFGSFLRVMHVCFGTVSEGWLGLLWVIAALSMTVGNVVALRQQSIKRMLAYSSIAHAGYALMGFLALGPSGGAEAVIFYLLAYGLMTVASFGVVMVVTAGTDAQYENDDLESFAGVGWSHPFLGLVMTVAMLSLGGIPPLAGFTAKLYIFSAAISAGYIGLTIIAAINSVVSLYYYLRVLVVMYFTADRQLAWSPAERLGAGPAIALGSVTFGTIVVGIFSELLVPAIETAVRSLG